MPGHVHHCNIWVWSKVSATQKEIRTHEGCNVIVIISFSCTILFNTYVQIGGIFLLKVVWEGMRFSKKRSKSYEKKLTNMFITREIDKLHNNACNVKLIDKWYVYCLLAISVFDLRATATNMLNVNVNKYFISFSLFLFTCLRLMAIWIFITKYFISGNHFLILFFIRSFMHSNKNIVAYIFYFSSK